MTNFATRFVLSTALIAATGLCQDLEADVVRNPDDTVTYTVDIDGPPRGAAFVYTSLRLAPAQQIPGIFGNWLLDPLLMAPIGFVTLDPQGKGRAQLVAPEALANEVPLHFQALVIDNVGQLAFAAMAAAAPAAAPAAPAPAPPQFVSGTQYKAANQTLTTKFTLGPPNAQVTVLVNGGQKAQGFMILNGAGQGMVDIPIPGGLERGDTVTILINGQPVANWRH